METFGMYLSDHLFIGNIFKIQTIEIFEMDQRWIRNDSSSVIEHRMLINRELENH